jgi:hypothetical protein
MTHNRVASPHDKEKTVSDLYAEIAKVFVPGVIGIVGGYFVKKWEVKRQDHKVENDLWSTQKQSHWSPLLRATRELKTRFEFLRDIYLEKPGMPFDPKSLSGDFRELYMLSRAEIPYVQDCDPNAPRKDEHGVQHIRARVCHELTFAESSLYITVKYLGNAEHVWRDLNEDLLNVPKDARDELMRLILNVRESLQGKSGAGIFHEQQEYIGETVWSTAGRVITNLEFRKRLFDLPGWEQFKNLLRFFVEFAPKLEYEVKDTIVALGDLEKQVDQLRSCPSKRDYEALRSSPRSNGLKIRPWVMATREAVSALGKPPMRKGG